jgi:hypothetical protein
MERLRARFGPPVHGWMRLALEGVDGEVEFEFSYTPVDSLRDLAEQLRAVHENGLSRTVRFCCEPAEIDLRFEVLTGGRTRITVTRWPGVARTGSDHGLFAWEGATDDLALAFWRALRRLQAESFAAGNSPQWSHPFPAKDVELLGRSLGR